MKYRIGNQVINSDHIVRVIYLPSTRGDSPLPPLCEVTLSSVSTAELDKTLLQHSAGPTSDTIVLRGAEADAFWEAYSGDAYIIVAKGEAE